MSCNCCDYGCTASHNCPARPTPATAAERAAQFQAETDRATARNTTRQQPTRHTSQELPNPTADLFQQPEPPSRLSVATAYGAGLAICLTGLGFLAGYATHMLGHLK